MVRRVTSLALALGVAGSALAFLPGFTEVAHADSTSVESAFVNDINALRASKGLRPLSVDPRLVNVARGWSQQMASSNNLSHNPNLANQSPSDWTKLGENVGYGGSESSIHQAFVNSPHHYANLVDPAFNAVGVGVVQVGNTVWVTEDFEQAASAPTDAPAPVAQSVPGNPTQGYWLVARDGGIFSFGVAGFQGSTGGQRLNQPIVGMTAHPGGGYWFVAADGGIFAFGAPFFGSMGGQRLNQPIVGMASTPSGNGYWLVARDGGIFSYGDAAFYGSTGGTRLNQPIVGMSSTPSGRGYWLVARDGGIFSYGDASFFGSTGSQRLNQPIVGMAPTPSGNGYWFVASDGGVFTYGDAGFHGSAGGQALGSPVVGISSAPNGGGYRLATANGVVLSYGAAEFDGALAGAPLNQPVVGMAAR
jgi:hypothetical protein